MARQALRRAATAASRRRNSKAQPESFERLDRDRDGIITARDFDWSEQSPFLQKMATLNPWIYRLDADSNGRISRKEWLDFFEKAAHGKDHLTPEDLRMAVMPPAPPEKQGTAQGHAVAQDAARRSVQE